MKTQLTRLLAAPLALLAIINLNSQLSTFAQGTAFNYQGNLIDSGQPANNLYDLTFTLWNASTTGGGSPVGVTFTNLATPVTNGLFTVTVDFSATPPNPPNTPNPFTGAPLWLQIGVRPSSTGPAGAFTEISPLQPILTSPYAIFANTASNVSGTVSSAQVTSIGNSGGGGGNFFVGPAGNTATSGSANTALGVNALNANTTGSANTASGLNALSVNTSGSGNTADGYEALQANTSGSNNTAVGSSALTNNTSGNLNTAVGFNAARNVIGNNNTVVGADALADTLFSSGLITSNNTAIGTQALWAFGGSAGLGVGYNNIALGYQAGIGLDGPETNNIDIGNPGVAYENNTIRLGDPSVHTAAFIAGVINGNGGGLTNLNASQLTSFGNGEETFAFGNTYGNFYVGSAGNSTAVGFRNTAMGDAALVSYDPDYSYSDETAVGFQALQSDLNGTYNTAIGSSALYGNTLGVNNTAIGGEALHANTSGNDNTAIGVQALLTDVKGSGNSAIGYKALYNSTGINNIALGYMAGSAYDGDESANIDIGNEGSAGENNAMHIGTQGVQVITTIAGIYGSTPNQATATAVYVDANGQLGTVGPTGGSGGGSGPLPSYVVTNGETQFVALSNGLYVAGLVLPAITTTTMADTILSGTTPLLYNDYYGDFCAGQSAGKRLNTSITHPANTAIGAQALYTDVNAGGNSAIGYQALYNCTGSGNIALGIQAGNAVTTGVNNIDIGNAGASTDNNIIRIGAAQTYAFIAGIISGNGAGLTSLNGAQLTGVITGNGGGLTNLNASQLTSAGNGNFFVGPAGNPATSSHYNTAIGVSALTNAFVDGDSGNTAVGNSALQLGRLLENNTAIGYEALNQVGQGSTGGGNNIAVGYQAGYNFTGSESDNIDIGNTGKVGENNTIRLGDPAYQTSAYIAGISSATVSGGAAVYVDTTTGQLGVESSSARFKTDIQGMGDASDVLLALQPVTFKYKPGIDPKGLPQFGLIAEQVENVDPELVVHDDQHGIYTVRYEAVNAMLLNEFQKEHRTVERQKTELEALKQKAGRVDALEQRLNELEQMVQTLAEKK